MIPNTVATMDTEYGKLGKYLAKESKPSIIFKVQGSNDAATGLGNCVGNTIVIKQDNFSFEYTKRLINNVVGQRANTKTEQITSDTWLMLRGNGVRAITAEKYTMLYKNPALRQTSGVAILLSHGSFNPVHIHHIGMMKQAKNILESKGYIVVLGIMAITHNRCLQKKRCEIMKPRHRMQALRLACIGSEDTKQWLIADEGD